MAEKIEWLSGAAFKKLQDELARREGELRDEIKEKIAAAREEGDLKENGGYHAARDEQGKNEARIKELKYRLEHAEVGTADADGDGLPDTIASPGKLITAELNNSGKPIKFVLGSRENADPDNGIDAFSPESPLGQAIIGHKAGEELSYTAPNGREIPVKLISAEEFV